MKVLAIRSSMIVMIISLFMITGCDKVSGLFSVPISDILSNPREYEGKRITISGTVGDSVTLIFLKAYVLGDKTGKIYVITDRILPRKDEKISVQGTVEELFEFGGQKATVFREVSIR